MNYWFWLFLLVLPLLVFSAKPQTGKLWRITRLLLALLWGYGCINMALALSDHIALEEIKANPQPIHEKLMQASSSGASSVFMLVLGWLWAAAYVGWWEMGWRKCYQLPLRKGVGDDRVSNIIVTISAYIALFVGVLAVVGLIGTLYELFLKK